MVARLDAARSSSYGCRDRLKVEPGELRVVGELVAFGELGRGRLELLATYHFAPQPMNDGPSAVLSPVDDQPVPGASEGSRGIVLQAYLVLNQPCAYLAKRATSVQPGQPHLAVQLAHPPAPPIAPAQIVGCRIPPQRNKAARLTIVTGGHRLERGYRALVAELVKERGWQRERNRADHD